MRVSECADAENEGAANRESTRIEANRGGEKWGSGPRNETLQV